MRRKLPWVGSEVDLRAEGRAVEPRGLDEPFKCCELRRMLSRRVSREAQVGILTGASSKCQDRVRHSGSALSCCKPPASSGSPPLGSYAGTPDSEGHV